MLSALPTKATKGAAIRGPSSVATTDLSLSAIWQTIHKPGTPAGAWWEEKEEMGQAEFLFKESK